MQHLLEEGGKNVKDTVYRDLCRDTWRMSQMMRIAFLYWIAYCVVNSMKPRDVAPMAGMTPRQFREQVSRAKKRWRDIAQQHGVLLAGFSRAPSAEDQGGVVAG